ncbi:hypothetical protein QFC22_006696 [Naganishia vaughanmartiniae]|uniref:Uncharacterized protein n=1 Tax=Naganishia vaughanmartiniae TaxID=1424756 RepID=A0ACC2WH42_9TREE|nr:hypothetical protein QFC22_006696 [Naganishia vaughanmartiniae]
MTRSHAKNNTSGSVFTYYERNRTEYGSKTQRIGADSMKKIDACYLCLNAVRNPVACSKGHVYCKECILSSLISQKAQIKAHQASLEAFAEQEQQEREKAKVEARERVLRDFERGLGLGGVRIASTAAMMADTEKKIQLGREAEDGVPKLIEGSGADARGIKRKFELDQSAVEKAAQAAEEMALKALEAEQVESRKAKLPSFWLPTLTPEATIGPLKDIKLQTMCNVGDHPHPLALKNLLPVHFTYPASSKSDATNSTKTPICPSCSREISNSTKSILLTSKTPASAEEPAAKKAKKEKGNSKEKEEAVCGHVVCSTCAETIVRPGKQCVVCEAVIRPDKDMIELGREGTGFAAAGGAQAKREGVAFMP